LNVLDEKLSVPADTYAAADLTELMGWLNTAGRKRNRRHALW